MRLTNRLASAPSLALALFLGAAVVGLAQGRISGTVLDVSGNVVTVEDGTSFAVTDSTRVVLSSPGTTEDLVPGRYIAITAARLDDGTLLASMINVFPETQRGSPGFQFVQADGNLMTNANIDEATIDAVTGSLLMVSFDGGTEQVNIPSTAQIMIRSDGTLADIQPGQRVSANVQDGVASSVTMSA
jgi:Domain of unknown function (DUF5666)